MRILGIVALGAAPSSCAPPASDNGPAYSSAKFRQQKHARIWAKADEDILRRMVADGESVAKIALKLKRRRQAIVARANRLHLSWSK
jgi:hypothetical protein